MKRPFARKSRHVAWMTCSHDGRMWERLALAQTMPCRVVQRRMVHTCRTQPPACYTLLHMQRCRHARSQHTASPVGGAARHGGRSGSLERRLQALEAGAVKNVCRSGRRQQRQQRQQCCCCPGDAGHGGRPVSTACMMREQRRRQRACPHARQAAAEAAVVSHGAAGPRMAPPTTCYTCRRPRGTRQTAARAGRWPRRTCSFRPALFDGVRHSR